MSPESEISRANEASQILNNHLVQEALGGIKHALIQQWRLTPLRDRELREQIWAIFTATCKFEEILESHITTGKMAAVAQEQKRSWAEKAREFLAT